VHKVVFVVDRKDLDYQTTKEFNSFSKGSIDGTSNTQTLVKQLAGDNKLIVTTIQKLNTLITENGAETILYSTWSYRDGTDKLATTGLTYNEFYQVLTDGYLQASIQYDTLIAPVGTAFYNLYYDHPEINMYQDDDFHPSVAGSFVAAYIFHTVIFGEENNDIYKPAGISDSLAVILRQYASGAFVNTSE